MTRNEQFVAIVRSLLQHADQLLAHAAVDKVANREFVELLDTAGTLADDHMRPTRPYVDVMIPNPRMVEHSFQEVDS